MLSADSVFKITFKSNARSAFLVMFKATGLKNLYLFTHKAGTVLTERGLHICGLSKSMDETHLAVKQRAGFHEVVYHLLPADLPVPVRESRPG